MENRKDYRRQIERRAAKPAVTVRHDDDPSLPPKRIRRAMITRRGMLQGAGMTAAAALLLPAKSCGSTTQYEKWLGVFSGALHDISPILTDMGAGSVVALVDKALPIVDALKKAFHDNDAVTIRQLLENLLNPQTGLVIEISAFIAALASDTRKRTIQGILAIGLIALRLIEANAPEEVKADAARMTARKAVVKRDPIEAAFDAVRF